MARKRHKPDEIVTKLRQVEGLRGQGVAMSDAVRQIGVSELTFYRWLPTAGSGRRAVARYANPTRFAGHLKRGRQAHHALVLNRTT